jgi:hypothetical protein
MTSQMTRMKTLSAVMILSAAIATPVFAQDAGVLRPQHERTHERNYRGAYNAYNQANEPSYAAPRTREEERNVEDFGFSGRDPSRVGGEDPDLKPSY